MSHELPGHLVRYRNRADAGRQLARSLSKYGGRSDVLVLGLPRGGVPVASVVASALSAPLDVFLVRKLGVPWHEELAMGAIAEGGVEVLSNVVEQLEIPRRVIDQVAARERLELDRRDRLYRGDRHAPAVRDRTVILVDDGLATGATMEAAALALRILKPARIVVAAPVGARETCVRLGRVADEVVCPSQPEPFSAVGGWYDDFQPTTDEEVRRLLSAAGRVASIATHHSLTSDDPVDWIRRRGLMLSGNPAEYEPIVNAATDAQVVLIGEATHGTHEFYRERALITRRLIEERGFNAVAAEADWPDAYRVNRYVRAVGSDGDAVDALADFRRFPAWMWRNADVLDFIGWLRSFNDTRGEREKVGFYGLDLYSLRASIAAVLSYLRTVDPEAATRAERRYGCFDRYEDDAQHYAYAASLNLSQSCEREVVSQLVELRRRAADYARRDGRIAADEYFVAEQNARVIRNAEAYYRTMLGSRTQSWNLRDSHMNDTLHELIGFLGSKTRPARIVVWAHNSHLGDARATEMGWGGELNLGQLAREKFGSNALLIGFTTHTGTVTAASEWDGPAIRKQVRPSLPGSYERILHDAGIRRCLLPLRTDLELASVLSTPRMERAIGVLYLPQTERRSHYFHARLAEQYDYLIHIDDTRAVEPLERTAFWDTGDVAETYPSGL